MSGGRGLFLVFEGVEGAGKSTQVGRLASRLRERGLPFLLAREPGGTPAGERIRAVVLDPDLAVRPETELLLYLAARAAFVREVVGPALERGELVIADRYELSTYAYQGVGRGLGLERVRELNAFATGGLKPDLTFLLWVDPRDGLARKEAGERAGDRLERERASFHRRVAEAYGELARVEPGVVLLPASGGAGELAQRIWEEVVRRWPERFGG